MKLFAFLFGIILFLISSVLIGQDTVSVYFEFGSTKISANQFETLNAIQTKYNLSGLDSIHFIGVADSIGNLKSNVKLCTKRAKNVFNYCKQLLPQNIPTKIIALGESTQLEINKNRRVDIVLFFQLPQTEELEEKEIIEKEIIGKENRCFNIDYVVLHRCHIRTITKRKKEFVVVETTYPKLLVNKTYYSGSKDKNGVFVPKKVKWVSQPTGRKGSLWKEQTLYTATIPKKDFETYKIFEVSQFPCDSCSEDFMRSEKISKANSCIQVDRFLMDHLQFKKTFLSASLVNIRVPREYVTIEDQYYIGCGLSHRLKWEIKKGKRKKIYYYSKLPKYYTPRGNYLVNITKISECCKSKPDPSECDAALVSCGGDGGGSLPFGFNIEAGNYYQQKTMMPYAAIGKSVRFFYSRVNFLVGTDTKRSFYSSLKYQYNLIIFPLDMFNPIDSWKDLADDKSKNWAPWIGKIYTGTELKTRINKEIGNYLEQNIHVGLSAETMNNKYAFIPKVFIQYGLGFDYLGFNSRTVYPVIQAGINIGIPIRR